MEDSNNNSNINPDETFSFSFKADKNDASNWVPTSSKPRGIAPSDLFSNIDDLSGLVGAKEFIPQSIRRSNLQLNQLDEESKLNYPPEPFPSDSLFKIDKFANTRSGLGGSSQIYPLQQSLFWACGSCGLDFPNEPALRLHEVRCMAQSRRDIGNFERTSHPTRELSSMGIESVYTCDDCNIMFRTLSDYHHHLDMTGHRRSSQSIRVDRAFEPPRMLRPAYSHPPNISGPVYRNPVSVESAGHLMPPSSVPIYNKYPVERDAYPGYRERHDFHPSTGPRYPPPPAVVRGYEPARPIVKPAQMGYGREAQYAGYAPSVVSDYRFVPSDRRGYVYFAGISKKDCLTGGCGWCVLDEAQRVIAQGSCYVVQNFPSLIRLEYEALLNGLKAALTNSISRLLIAGSSSLVLSYINSEKTITNFLSVFRSIQAETDDLMSNVSIALRGFREVRTEYLSDSDNAFAIKLAEKALHAFQKKRKKEINRIVFTDYGLKNAQKSSADVDEYRDEAMFSNDIIEADSGSV